MSTAAGWLLQSLGYPEDDAPKSALADLHAGAAFHRLALIVETVEAYRAHALFGAEGPAYLGLLQQALGGEAPRASAERHYREALRKDDILAEAWFNLGRLLQHSREESNALDAFVRAAALPPHEHASPYAQLHANAHWHAATILEELCRDQEALHHYREAISRCENFGVHHVRYAHFLRRQGLISEAIVHYERMMTYGHRYFTEFVLPPLSPSKANRASVEALDIIYETTGGAVVVYWNNLYWRVPAQIQPATPERMAHALNNAANHAKGRGRFRAFLTRLRIWSAPIALRSATSISELEDGRR